MKTDERLRLMLAAAEDAPKFGRFRQVQRLWRSLPVPDSLRRGVTAALYRFSSHARSSASMDQQLAELNDLLAWPTRAISPGRFVLSGYLSDTSGIGRAGRLSLDAFLRAGFAPLAHDLRRNPEGWGEIEEGGLWFCHCNAIEAAEFVVRERGPRACYRIGYWAWELPNLPPQWLDSLGLFHEIWTPSRFVRDAVQRALPPRGGPMVRLVPHPLEDLSAVLPDRDRFGMPQGVFVFLAMYDVHSSATRKNPMAAVEAFQRAFSPDRVDVQLCLKVVAAHESQGCLPELERQVEGWPNIRILTDMLSDNDANRLLRSADAFVSLHRAEGFGLSIAQAMAMGRPVVVTAWSGNMDFCDAGALRVGYRLIPVRDPHGVYSAFETPDQRWADPDLDQAAEALQTLADDPEAARRLGEAARRHVHTVLPNSYETTVLRTWIAG